MSPSTSSGARGSTVDRQLVLADDSRLARDPVRLGALVAFEVALEDQQVRDGFGAGDGAVAPAGSRTAPTRSARRLMSRRAAGLAASMRWREEGPRRCRPGGVLQRLDDEVVVQRVVARVAVGVVQRELSERHVADDRGKARGELRLGERLGPHVGVRVQMGGDLGGDRVELHADGLRAGGRQREEDPEPQPGSRTGRRQTEALGGLPHRLGDPRIGEVRVEDGPASLRALGVGEQLLEALARLVELAVGLGEHAGDRAPARPPRQRLTLGLGGGRAGFAQIREDLERLDVGGCAGGRAGGRDRGDVRPPTRAGQVRLRLSVSSRACSSASCSIRN